MMPVLATRAMSDYVLQGNGTLFSRLWALQSIFINVNRSYPKLRPTEIFEDTETPCTKADTVNGLALSLAHYNSRNRTINYSTLTTEENPAFTVEYT